MSSVPGKALRMLANIARLAEQFNMRAQKKKTEPGKLDIKRRKPGILFIGKPICLLFKLAIMT